MFYLDGAHSPESMDACAKWFCLATKEDHRPNYNQSCDDAKGLHESEKSGSVGKNPIQVLFGYHLYI